MSRIAATKVEKLSPKPQRILINELKKKYETKAAAAAQDIFKTPSKLAAKMEGNKSKVKQIASMFNSRISQIEEKGTIIKSKCNIQSPEAKTQTKACNNKAQTMPKIRHGKEEGPKAQHKSRFFVSEDNFHKLTVRDKAQLYTQFINEMAEKNPKFSKHVELMEATVKEINNGEVIHEKQASVKHLLEALEAKCAFPKQTISPLALEKIKCVLKAKKPLTNGKLPIKSKEFEDIFSNKISPTSTPTQKLQPNKSKVRIERSRSEPRCKLDREQIFDELTIIEPCHKRYSNEMHTSLPIDAYAPPKKIRRTRNEIFAPKIFFHNQKLQTLFFTWLSEKQKVKFNSAIDELLEETITNLETGDLEKSDQVQISDKSCKEKHKKRPAPPIPEKVNRSKAINSETDKYCKAKQISEKRKKRPAPPIPEKANTIIANSSEISTKYFTKPEESESGLSSIPKITSDESHADGTCEKESDNSTKGVDFSKDVKPARKKKLRRTLTCKKDTPGEEVHCIKSTDSDSDYRLAETKNKHKTLYVPNEMETTSETSLEDVEQTLMHDINSPTKIKSAYTLTVLSPTKCLAEARPGQATAYNQNIQHRTLDNKKSLSSNTTPSMTESLIDQGFETASANGMDSPARVPKEKRQDAKISVPPLFIKLSPATESNNKGTESPPCFSTPIKETSIYPCYHEQIFSPISTMTLKSHRKSANDTDSSRRSPLDMQVIRENHPLEYNDMASPGNLNSMEQVFFGNSPGIDKLCNDLCGLNPNKTSQFWFKCGEFSVSVDVFYNNDRRLRLLYEILGQKSCDIQDIHFGIDNKRFSTQRSYDYENIAKRLPASEDYSYYWFSTGDLAIPFMGKSITSKKIERFFDFIKAAVQENGVLRFGVDAVEFSNVSEFWQQSPKCSLNSTYSMLVGLQSGNSNGLEGRSKFAWPHTKSIRLSDLDQSDCEGEYFEDNDSYRLSLSPFGINHCELAALDSEELSTSHNSEAIMNRESFSFEYDKELLDRLFEQTKNLARGQQIKACPGPDMLNTLKTQQARLSLVREKISPTDEANSNSTDDLNALKGTPQYLQKLKNIVADIVNKGRSCGFKQCSVQQLKNYMFYLNRYADICLHSCTNHMDKVVDVLIDQRAVEV